MQLLPSKELWNVPNILLIGFAAIVTVLLLHLVTIWLEQKGSING